MMSFLYVPIQVLALLAVVLKTANILNVNSCQFPVELPVGLLVFLYRFGSHLLNCCCFANSKRPLCQKAFRWFKFVANTSNCQIIVRLYIVVVSSYIILLLWLHVCYYSCR